MPAWLVVLLYVVVILTIILIHEAAHFAAAKRYGIKVEEFFVGFGPRLWSFRRGDTEYGVKALPFGGYVRIAGMNPFQESPPEDEPRTFGARPIWQRATVIGAGPVSHFVMAILFLAIYFMAIGAPVFRPSVDRVEPTLNGQPSPAAVAGLRTGDVIVAVAGVPLASADDFVAYTRAHVGQPVVITLERDGHRVSLTATPVLSDVEGQRVGRLGIQVGAAMVGRDRVNPIVAVGRGFSQTWVTAKAVVLRLGDVFGPAGIKRIWDVLVGAQPRSQNDVVSVVGGARLAVEAVRVGAWDALFELLVVFNVFIGIMNLLPLPPLDGGHLAVLAYEKARGRRPDVRKLVPLTALVAGFLILFGLSVTYIDLVKPLPNPFR